MFHAIQGTAAPARSLTSATESYGGPHGPHRVGRAAGNPDRMGRRRCIRPARRRHQRADGSAAHPPGPHPLRAGAPRAVRRLHGLRLCQVDRAARRVPGHHRPRRHQPAHRSIRREVRPRPGARHHRPAVPRPDRHLDPAGHRPHQGVPGRRRVHHRHPRRPACPPGHRARLPPRAGRTRCRPLGHPRRRAGTDARGRRSLPAPQGRRFQRLRVDPRRTGRRRPGPRRGGAECRHQGRDPGRAGRTWRGSRVAHGERAAGRPGGQGAAGQGGAAG
jgi:hypothetical protein